MSKDNKNAFLAQYGTLKHIEESLKSDDGEIRYYVCKNPLLPIHHMETIVNDNLERSNHDGWYQLTGRHCDGLQVWTLTFQYDSVL